MITNPGLVQELSDSEFRRISGILYGQCGIVLHQGKEGLVKSRLQKRIAKLGLSSFNQYLERIESEPYSQELSTMIDALTTNKTSFFREPQHFEFLRREVVAGAGAGGLRIWSAGCSSGEEPYSLAILMKENLPQEALSRVRILATDISTRVLETARRGVYSEETLQDVPAALLRQHFECADPKPPRKYRIDSALQEMVRFARLNLMEDWPMRGPFDAIFCRNVMIYFDKATQQNLVRRFVSLLRPGGYLFVGHSESISSGNPVARYVQPAVYVK